MTRHSHFLSHVGQHELRQAIPASVCACGQPCMPNHSRCADCIERALTRWQELNRGELSGPEADE